MRLFFVWLFQRGTLGLGCLIIGASGVLGFIDGHGVGCIGSIMVSIIAQSPILYWLNLIGAYIEGPASPISDHSQPAQPASEVDQPPTARSLADLLFGFGLLTVIGLIIGVAGHEAYRLGNIVALTVNHNVCVTMMNSTGRGDSREYLTDALTRHEWPLTVCHSRPVRWLLSPDVAATNDSNLLMIQFVQGKGVEPPEGYQLSMTEQVKSELVAQLWRSDNWLALKMTDKSLNLYGLAVSENCKSQIEVQRSKGWLLRIVPAELLRH